MKLSENELVALLGTLTSRKELSEDAYRSLENLVGEILLGADPGARFRRPQQRGRPPNTESIWPVLHSEILRRRVALAKEADLQVCSYWNLKPETLKKYRRLCGEWAKTQIDEAALRGWLDLALAAVLKEKKREGKK